MAVFGVQLALSMIMASIISKLGPRFSLARFLLCSTGLIRFLHPSDEELREVGGVPKDITGKSKGKRKNEDIKNPNSFHIAKDLDIKLDSVPVTSAEVRHLRFYEEYHWVVDYTVYATVVYLLTEIYYGIVGPVNEMNLSTLWCFLSLSVCVSVLCSVTAMYFRGDEVMGERALCMVMALVYLLAAMMVLIIDDKNLDVGVDPAYESFHEKASAFLHAQGLPTTGPASKLILKFCLAVFAAFLGALFTFPGIRMSKMFNDSLKYCEEKQVLRSFINLAFIFPLILAVLWIRPLSRDVLTQPLGNNEPLMTNATFESMRLCLIVAMVILRICLMPCFLQSFLNVAQQRLIEQRKEAGRILNTDLQKKVVSIYYFLCVVALQYITPCVICLHFCFMYKTLGGGSWTGSWGMSGNQTDVNLQSPAMRPIMPDTDELKPAAEHFTLALSSLKIVFNETVFKGIFGFATWWSLFALFSSSCIGSLYLSYLAND